jgi:hypothetical protein
MSKDYPAPPPELVQEWQATPPPNPQEFFDYFATQAAQWGADQELEACCEWLTKRTTSRADADQLRAARRPKSPSLKAQALEILPKHPENMASLLRLTPGKVATLRRALEQLDD